jgi:MoxR-like ATPase
MERRWRFPSIRLSHRSEGALAAALGRRSVVLIGMMGAGKSSIGRRLAQRLGLPSSTPMPRSRRRMPG